MDKWVKRFNSAPLHRKKENSSSESLRTFSVSLDQLSRRDNSDIPLIMRKLCTHILEVGKHLEGIFRVNGNARLIENLRSEFDSNGDADLISCKDIYGIAGLLKYFLRELPEGLVPEKITDCFIEIISENDDDLVIITNFRLLLEELPSVNFSCMKFLCHFLRQIADNEYYNKMSPVSLGIVFGPNVFRCGEDLKGLQNQGFTNQIMRFFIDRYYDVFEPKVSSSNVGRVIHVQESSKGDSECVINFNTYPKAESVEKFDPRPKPRTSLQQPPQRLPDQPSYLEREQELLEEREHQHQMEQRLQQQLQEQRLQQQLQEQRQKQQQEEQERRMQEQRQKQQQEEQERRMQEQRQKQQQQQQLRMLELRQKQLQEEQEEEERQKQLMEERYKQHQEQLLQEQQRKKQYEEQMQAQKVQSSPHQSPRLSQRHKQAQNEELRSAPVVRISDEISPRAESPITLDRPFIDNEWQNLVSPRANNNHDYNISPTIQCAIRDVVSENLFGTEECAQGLLMDSSVPHSTPAQSHVEPQPARRPDNGRVEEVQLSDMDHTGLTDKTAAAFALGENRFHTTGPPARRRMRAAFLAQEEMGQSVTAVPATGSSLVPSLDLTGLGVGNNHYGAPQAEFDLEKEKRLSDASDFEAKNREPLSTIGQTTTGISSPSLGEEEERHRRQQLRSQTLKRIRSLKSRLRVYEDQFLREHGRAPTSAEKSSAPSEEVRLCWAQLGRERRMLRKLRDRESDSSSGVPMAFESGGESAPGEGESESEQSLPTAAALAVNHSKHQQAPVVQPEDRLPPPEPQPPPQLQPLPHPQPPPQLKPQLQPQLKSQPQPQLKSQPPPQLKSQPQLKQQPQPPLQPQPPPQLKPQPQPQQQLQQQMKPQQPQPPSPQLQPQPSPQPLSGNSVTVTSTPSSAVSTQKTTPASSARSITDSLDLIMTRLMDKRRQAGRPESLAAMNDAQVRAEKLALQKALLYFENIHGRPRSTEEKEVMKPLYDRYRAVKRLLGRAAGNSAGGGHTTPNSGLQSASVISVPTAGREEEEEETEEDVFQLTRDFRLISSTTSAGPGIGSKVTSSPSNIAAGRRTLGMTVSSTLDRRSDPRDTDLRELLDTQNTLRSEKKKLQRTLKQFEHEFEETKGHKVEKEDRIPMRSEYNQYKKIKTKLKQVERKIESLTYATK